MAFLSHADYLHLWTAQAPHGFGQIIPLPCYHAYLQREIYFSDYLDLYVGTPTFNRVPIGGFFYVQITGNPILGGLGIPEHEILTINLDTGLYILLDYDYPWTPAELEVKRSIKYVMIGEAAPSPNPTILGYGVDDTENSFFYNKLHLKNTNYFTEPCKVFNTGANPLASSLNKKNSLIELANKGVILIDIYPFAMSYSSQFRKSRTINPFYNRFIEFLIGIIPSLCPQDELKFALVGPTITTTKIINKSVILGGLLFGHYTKNLDILTNNGLIDNLNIWTAARYFVPAVSISPSIRNYHTLNPFFLNPNIVNIITFGHNIVATKQLSIIHRYRLIAVPIGLTGPHSIALAFAFDL